MHNLKSLFSNVILFPLIIGIPQFNFHYINGVYCLRDSIFYQSINDVYEIASYCMSESPVKYSTNNDENISNFSDLSKQNVTSQDLYRWSVPIDIIEDYQYYLNQLQSTSPDLTLGETVVYNCTLPKFGSLCQYELDSYHSNYSSLKEIIADFYKNYNYTALQTFTCYIHLKCNRGPHPVCLHWIEICDGKVDCLDGGQDEADCWQLEINECQDDEYRCYNGQCIPKLFHHDLYHESTYVYSVPDCADTSDELTRVQAVRLFCTKFDQPSFECEDLSKLANYYYVLSSYMQRYTLLFARAIYISDEHSALSQECSSTLKQLLTFMYYESESDEYSQCIQIIQDKCPDMFFFPSVPILFTEIYFAYMKTDFEIGKHIWHTQFYICFNHSRYDNDLVNLPKLSFHNTTCYVATEIIESGFYYSIFEFYISTKSMLYGKFHKSHLIFNYTTEICNRSSMYQCLYSNKCISTSRLMNTIYDCPYKDDENVTLINISEKTIQQLDKTHFKCRTPGEYIHPSLVENSVCDCSSCEEEHLHIRYLNTHTIFQHICDGFIDRLPELIDNRNETDESECEQWRCNNTYTRCNRIWNCPNGADEIGCNSYSTLNCSLKEHFCVQMTTYQFTCLPIEKVNDGIIDCIGATDEPRFCALKFQMINEYDVFDHDFYCKTYNRGYECLGLDFLCNNYSSCVEGDDERFCSNTTIENRCFSMFPFPRRADDDQGCLPSLYENKNIRTDMEKFLFDHKGHTRVWRIIYFMLDGPVYSYIQKLPTISSSLSVIQRVVSHVPHCHRGLTLRVWSNNLTCLCPPSYYGTQCQYQSQRVSLTMQFRPSASSWQTLFAIFVSLIDNSDQRMIHSYEQFTFLSVRDCQRKFNIYLLYSTQPKDPHKNYSIHIDVYEKVSFEYRGSLIYPVQFSFLPNYRLSILIDIPRIYDRTQSCLIDRCDHGQCSKYATKSPNDTFCKCDKGWTGKYCHIPYKCNCSFGSLCLGMSADNQSICLCSVNRFGLRCLLSNTICQTNDNQSLCQNNGQCIANNEYDDRSNRKFSCICQQGFRGSECEIIDDKLLLSFHRNLVPSQYLSIHFIQVNNNTHKPIRSTTYRTIPVQQDSIVIYWSRPFHLVFVEFENKNYYFAFVQQIYNQSASINATIKPSDRCANIREVFNETIVQLRLLRRIKYYHLPCQINSPDLKCFYDEKHLCLCYDFDNTRLANCIEFQHEITSDCWGQNECEHDGQCFQDDKICPQRSICICHSCFYGVRCQFSTNGFGLSLDAILGYHIYPYIDLTNQPLITQMSLGLTIIFVCIGLVNAILSILTFKNKTTHRIGCGWYLLSSSIITLLITIIFGLKFLFLLLIQMAIITNRLLITFQCYSFDFILRICLIMDQWLNACVAIERAISVIKKTDFDKRKSIQAAKYVIISLFFVITATCIHDPIHRDIIDEDTDDHKRSWCIVRYSSNLGIYNYIINSIHFFGPFLMNFISAIILIIKQAHQKSTIHTDRLYRQHLRDQYQENRHLLISPIVLILLAIPRLIITFVSKCMQSANDAWIFLIGYFIAFIPPMLTFLVFISPSKFYKQEFDKSIRQIRTIIRTHKRT